jgi:polysaccharide biosynthesis transport protein
MNSSDTNFVYKLLNFNHPHYSIKAISSIKAMRIGTSDLMKLTYEVNDPGICQQTLAIYNEVCTKNYKGIRENRSDDVVKYFENQLQSANSQLKSAEDKLLGFNKSNNIINYYEQSKAVAVVKEDMEMDYSNKKAQLAGHEAAIKRLEEKLNIQQLVQLKSNSVLEKKKQLGDINFEIATAEADANANNESRSKLPGLHKKSEELKNDIRKTVDELYAYQNTTDGLPVSKVLSEWINNVIEAENLRAKILVMDQRNREFQQQYAIYAPAGANIKRIEREINVSEQGYLEILHGLNLAKLKLQDSELSSELKAVDPPYYPLSPNPNKRKVLIIAAAFIGILLVLAAALLMEYFDDTLKNLKKASKTLHLSALGMIPKIYLNPGIDAFTSVQKRLLEICIQNIQQTIDSVEVTKTPKTIVFLSTQEKEGKSVLAGNICKELKAQGKKVIFLNYAADPSSNLTLKRFPFIHRLLGYQDPRINYNHPFLQKPSSYLAPTEYFHCKFGDEFSKFKSFTEILDANGIRIDFIPDYVLIELPAILNTNYPACIVAAADMNVLVCRSNRIWSEADQTAFDTLPTQAAQKTKFLLNGVEIQELESLLGELPKKRSIIRKKLKNLFRFQFFSKNQF